MNPLIFAWNVDPAEGIPTNPLVVGDAGYGV